MTQVYENEKKWNTIIKNKLVSGNCEQRRSNIDKFRAHFNARKVFSLQQLNLDGGPPKYIEAPSDHSVISECTLSVCIGVEDSTSMSISDGIQEIETRESNDVQHLELNKCSNDSGYIRQLEIELVALKMKLAQSYNQIDQIKFMANKEQVARKKLNEELQRSKLILHHENMKLKSELAEERTKMKELELKNKEQMLTIDHLANNVQRMSRGNSQIISKSNLLKV